MNILSNIIMNYVIKLLEQQFISNAPALQQALLNEVSASVKALSNWLESKMSIEGAPSDEEKGK